MNDLDVLVVGGGISGLAVAHGLARAGLEVRVWESSDRAGGKIRTVTRAGYRLESAATMVVNMRGEIDAFVRSAGLESAKRRCAPATVRYVLDGERLHEVPMRVGGLLRTPLISVPGKLRLMLEPLVPRGSDEQETVAQFATRRLGKEFFEKFFEPYVAGPLASDADRAEACSAIPRLVALEHRHGSLAVGALLARLVHRRAGGARPQMFSFASGMQTLVDRLACDGGFGVELDRRATGIAPVAGGWEVQAQRGAVVRVGHLVLSVPADVAAELLGEVDHELAGLLQAIEYAPIRVLHTGFERSAIAHALNGSGFLVPRGSSFAATGCLWMSRLFADCAPAERVLLTTYLGGARNPRAAEWGDARALDAVMQMLRTLLGARAQPELLQSETHARALPVYHGPYSRRLAAVADRLAQLPGLHLVGNYRGGVSVRDRLISAQVEVDRIARQLTAHNGRSAWRDPPLRPAGDRVGSIGGAVAAIPS